MTCKVSNDMVTILDQQDKIRKIDKSDMLRDLAKTADYCRDAIKRTKPIIVPENVNPKNILVVGMGGSAIGGELLQGWLRDELSIPIKVCRDYTLPAYINKDTLVFVNSYSGNTEETLTAFLTAIKRKCTVLAITSGGQLEAFCKKLQVPHVVVPSGLQPRVAIPYMFFPLPSLIFAGIIPVFVVITIYGLLYAVFRFSRNTFYLLTLSTIFGSFAFFGIPFITFAFPSEQTERLATLAASTIGIVAIAVSITILELYRLGESSKIEGLKQVATRLARNPLIVSIGAGILISVIGVEIPSPVSTFLHMTGGTTSAVAVFMLGAFLYGKRYVNLTVAFSLSLLRIAFLPAVALATLMLFKLPTIDQSVLVLMNTISVAFSLSVLSERYDFYKETIASLTLISSLGVISLTEHMAGNPRNLVFLFFRKIVVFSNEVLLDYKYEQLQLIVVYCRCLLGKIR